MGGCRCSYRNCQNTTKSTDNMHFFHFPVKHKERCKKWIENSQKFQFFDLDQEQLRNKVICEDHFEENGFPNSEHKRLLPTAVPTLDGSNCYDVRYQPPKQPHKIAKKPGRKVKYEVSPTFLPCKLEDVEVMPANDDGTIFLLETNPTFNTSKEIKSYIYSNDSIVPMSPDNEDFPMVKEEIFVEEYNANSDEESTDYTPEIIPKKELLNQTLFKRREHSEESPEDTPLKKKRKSIEDFICKSVESKCLERIEQHTKEITSIKQMLQSSQNQSPGSTQSLSKTSVLKYLKDYLPPSLYFLVELQLGKTEISESDVDFLRAIVDKSEDVYNMFIIEYDWKLPELEM